MSEECGEIKLIDEQGLRTDGRKPDEIRKTIMKVGVLKNADGSSYLEQGRNKILVAVYGPEELHPKHLALPDKALLQCRYHMLTFSTDERRSPAPSRRDIELSKVIKSALEPAILLEKFPMTTIRVLVEVIQSDGGTRCAGITAASIALANAGIPMRDLVVACAAGKVDGQYIVDLNADEDKLGEADLVVAIMPQRKLVTLIQMDGSLTLDEFKKVFELAKKGCYELYNIQRKALLEHYEKVAKEVSQDDISK